MNVSNRTAPNPHHHLLEVQVSPASAADGAPASILRLPFGCALVGLGRSNELLSPEPGSRLQAGDVLWVTVDLEHEADVHLALVLTATVPATMAPVIDLHALRPAYLGPRVPGGM